jgi:hypothetical protein
LLRDAALLLAALLCCACKPEPIEWGEPTPLPSTLASTTDLAFDAERRLVARPPASIPLPVFTSQCTGSVRVARDTTGDWYAVWWSARLDSTALVVVSRSTDGVTWGPAVEVDSTDAGRVGCRRAGPSIAVDGQNVHVAYAMPAREGPGIFASHSMDRGMTFHSPVAVVYGEHIGGTAIAAQGQLVAVAYEDPNSDPQRVAVAFSRTMAHTFETRELASPPTGAARDPGIALGDGKIVVTWARGVAGAATDASAPRVMRIGELR